MNYEQALEYIHSTCWLGSKPGLSRTYELLNKLGNPQNKLKFIHIAGTNGKGSVASMLSCILEKAGFKVGLYTSPYIDRFNERMRINNVDIPDIALCKMTELIKPYADAMVDHPTEFELITCLAMQWFYEENCDIVVLETGLGGELDSTNVITTPELAIITSISFDHTAVLGDTIEQIASAKAGIIKQNGKVIIGSTNETANTVFLNKASEKNASVYYPEYAIIEETEHCIDGYTLNYKDIKGIKLALTGSYQLQNAAIVLKACEVLCSSGYKISEEDIKAGLAAVKWNARFEVLSKEPLFIVDGGHNPDGVNAAADSIRKLLPNQKLTFIFAVMADKEYDDMLKTIAPLAKRLVAAAPMMPRALKSEELCRAAKAAGIEAYASNSIAEAVDMALKFDDAPIIALGSLYMSGEVRSLVKERLKR